MYAAPAPEASSEHTGPCFHGVLEASRNRLQTCRRLLAYHLPPDFAGRYWRALRGVQRSSLTRCMSYAPPGSAPTLPPPGSGARRALLATPGGPSVSLPSATEAAADFQSLPSSTLAAILDGLGLDTSASGNLRL